MMEKKFPQCKKLNVRRWIMRYQKALMKYSTRLKTYNTDEVFDESFLYDDQEVAAQTEERHGVEQGGDLAFAIPG